MQMLLSAKKNKKIKSFEKCFWLVIQLINYAHFKRFLLCGKMAIIKRKKKVAQQGIN